MNKCYAHDTLYGSGPQRSFDEHCNEATFLLGGIGTGNVSVGSRGQLRDWEIFDGPGKGNYLPNTFFALYTKQEGAAPLCKVLEAEIQPPYAKSHGFVDYEVGGLPRFASSRMTARYPFVSVELSDPTMPVAVTLEAFTPFIPLNADDSGIPTAWLTYRVHNTTSAPLAVSVAGSLANMSSLIDYDRHTWNYHQRAAEGVIRYREEEGLRGLFMEPKDLPKDHFYRGSLALTTPDESVTYKRKWLNGGWWDGLQDFWDDVRADGKLEPESVYTAKDATYNGPDDVGSLAIHHTLAAGEERAFAFQISWHFPRRVDCWSRRMYDSAVRALQQKNQEQGCDPGCGEALYAQKPLPAGEYPSIQKYYARLFDDAWAAARYTATHFARLHGDSKKFTDAFFSTTLPPYVLDAVSANITVLRSNTCFRLHDGTLMGWEGCFTDDGCCEGNCTHVWNYTQTIAFLFPELERSMRRLEYGLETQPDGKMNFRSYQLWGMGAHDHAPAADGQLGTLVRLYRDWKFSGDTEFLRSLWPAAKSTLDYAFSRWDKDGDFVLDTDQFNTYDIAFQGPNSMINSLFFAALLAGAEMANAMGDSPSAARYREAFEKGSARMDALLWSEDRRYYIQKLDDVNEYRYQYGEGCLSDQLFGQTLAFVAGLGYVLPHEHVRATLQSIFNNNFITSLRAHHNTQRTYALNGEHGLLLCTWPGDQGRPRLPFPYSDEIWTGIEYQVATSLIYEGLTDEGLTLVKAVRDRHDGIRRNPWNEVECGFHYARSMASYGVFLALCGFAYDMTQGKISFAPATGAQDFRCFFSTGKSWGIYARKDGQESLEVLYGDPNAVSLA